MPPGLDHIYFTSCGSEANAAANHFARIYTGNYPILTLKNGYHGHMGVQHLTNLSNYNHSVPKTQGVETVTFPDLYRGQWTGEDAGLKYAQDVKDTIIYNTSGQVACMMIEPVQGAGGI